MVSKMMKIKPELALSMKSAGIPVFYGCEEDDYFDACYIETSNLNEFDFYVYIKDFNKYYDVNIGDYDTEYLSDFTYNKKEYMEHVLEAYNDGRLILVEDCDYYWHLIKKNPYVKDDCTIKEMLINSSSYSTINER